jgi:hypothetical protein
MNFSNHQKLLLHCFSISKISWSDALYHIIISDFHILFCFIICYIPDSLFIVDLLKLLFIFRYTMERPRFSDHLEAIKFICKDFWSELFKKQIDNLKTNHRVMHRIPHA